MIKRLGNRIYARCDKCNKVVDIIDLVPASKIDSNYFIMKHVCKKCKVSTMQ